MKRLHLVLIFLFAFAPLAHAVIGGAAAPDLMRHTVMVLSKKGSICSGALIAPRTVLTAAHCVTDGSDNAVHVRKISGEPILLIPSKKIIHPGYVADAIQKRVRSIDLALIHLNDPLPDEFVPVPISDDAPRAGETVTIGGYGMTDESKRNSTGKFFATPLDVIEPYGPSKILLWLKGRASDRMTGGCHGDSGGPLFREGALVAITTWTTGAKGRDCGELTQGALIAPQRAWINANMK